MENKVEVEFFDRLLENLGLEIVNMEEKNENKTNDR